ncbi:hypothetical protein Ddye_005075 [Dipteronia dyeriana]|uniref:Reverse transcriptase n=1 Tax=Dipteronia dyeriana TaxID=168575 RepID=A0AAE0CPD2_9ROSI|nr:hypothetical protein Ddye_005075 [Dipteronia dyeriana]
MAAGKKKGEEIKNVISNYFKALFSTSNPPMDASEMILKGICMSLSNQKGRYLEADFTSVEIRKAIFGMGHLKAPGKDGFPAAFYQKIWVTVGKMLRMCVWRY